MRSAIRHSSLGIFLTTVGLLLVCYAVLRKEFVSLFSGLFFLGLITFILLAHAVHHLLLHARVSKYKIHYPHLAQIHEHLSISVDAPIEKGISPFFYQIELIARFYSRPTQTITMPMEIGQTARELVWQLPWRGCYHIEAFISSWDIFGFFYERVAIPTTQNIEIAPSLPHKTLPLTTPLQENINSLTSGKLRSPSPESVDSREYYPGDDPRRINWKQSTRFHKLFVRQENLYQPLVHHVRYVLFPPPLTTEGPDLLDHLIDIMLQLIASYPRDTMETSIVIGSLFLENFNPALLGDRSQLSACYAGMVYENNKSVFDCPGMLVFLGVASDPLFLDALQKYHNLSPTLFITDSLAHEQTIQNIVFLSKSLKMDVYHV